MSDLFSGLIVVAVTGALIGLIFILVAAQKRKRDNALRTLASMNGWSFEPVNDRTSSGWRMHKGDWIMESLNLTTTNSSENSNVNSMTRWFCDAARMKEGMVLIGPRQPEIDFGGMGAVLMQVALRLMIGDEAADAVDIQRVELGSIELMERYMVWTNREALAKQLLDDPLENALRAWPLKMPPVVKFSPAGLEIKVQSMRMYKEEDLTALVKLGNTLLDSAYQVEKDGQN